MVESNYPRCCERKAEIAASRQRNEDTKANQRLRAAIKILNEEWDALKCFLPFRK